MDDKYVEPSGILNLMTVHVRPTDACTGCGYQFGDIEEGCDECEPITVVLIATDRAFSGEE